MQIISESSRYKSLNSKTDLMLLIREYAAAKQRDLNKYTFKILRRYTKPQLFCIFASISQND
jgi:hypothetical protein